MCGRYSLATPNPSVLRERFGLGDTVAIRVRYNVAPGDDVLAVLGGPRRSEPEAMLVRWGLVPHWSRPGPTRGKAASSGFTMINARAETLSDRPAYREALRERRCLVIADGFYEWERTEHGRRPWWISRADGAPFAFAALWASSRAVEGDILRSCSIVTTAAGPRLRALHDRTPVILERRAEATWLAAASAPAELRDALVPLPEADLGLRRVSTAVNDARYDGPACLEPPAPDPAPAAAPRLF